MSGGGAGLKEAPEAGFYHLQLCCRTGGLDNLAMNQIISVSALRDSGWRSRSSVRKMRQLRTLKTIQDLVKPQTGQNGFWLGVPRRTLTTYPHSWLSSQRSLIPCPETKPTQTFISAPASPTERTK